jgi:PadR family transcriptional regulator PadR
MYFTLLGSCDNLIIVKYIILLCTPKGGEIMNKEMLKGTIDILILSVLSKGENYGYEISRIIKMKTEGAFEILEATMYLALKRLENQRAIDFFWGDESGGGRRKYFKITELGKEQLIQLSNDWKETVEIVGKFI